MAKRSDSKGGIYIAFLKGVFALITFAFGELMRLLAANWHDVTGGPQGMRIAYAPEPLAGIDLAWKAKAGISLDRRKIEVDEGEVDLGQLRLLGSGTYERSGDDHRVRASIDMPIDPNAATAMACEMAAILAAYSFGHPVRSYGQKRGRKSELLPRSVSTRR